MYFLYVVDVSELRADLHRHQISNSFTNAIVFTSEREGKCLEFVKLKYLNVFTIASVFVAFH